MKAQFNLLIGLDLSKTFLEELELLVADLLLVEGELLLDQVILDLCLPKLYLQ